MSVSPSAATRWLAELDPRSLVALPLRPGPEVADDALARVAVAAAPPTGPAVTAADARTRRSPYVVAVVLRLYVPSAGAGTATAQRAAELASTVEAVVAAVWRALPQPVDQIAVGVVPTRGPATDGDDRFRLVEARGYGAALGGGPVVSHDDVVYLRRTLRERFGAHPEETLG